MVELPAGATVENWYAEGSGSKAVPSDPKVAFVGNDVYISGIFSDLPNAWIKGTIDGTTATFESLQYMGKYGTSTDIWAIGTTNGSSIAETFTFTYDATAKTLTFDEGQYLIANAASDKVYYLAYIQTLTLYAEKPAPTQIDELPYSNGFDDADSNKQFSVIDANEDGSTWVLSAGDAHYTYNSTNNADDWLVSPAIKLVAGKKYHFAIDAKAAGSTYPEKFEVKAATEATAEALAAGTTVIEEQTIRNTSAQTFENEAFTVSTTGYYHIGVHATSAAEQFKLTVDNFLIEAAPITAPYIADFSTSAPFDDFSVLDANGDGKTWSWSSSYGAFYTYNSSKAADDYLILPIKLAAGTNYNVIVTAKARSTSYPEKFEVVAGKSVDALTTTIIPETEIKVATDTEYDGSFTADADGTYYVAIHATSDENEWFLCVSKFEIAIGAEATAPAAATDLTAEAGAEGALEVNLAFNAPATAINGAELSGTEDVKIYRDDELVNTLTGVAPGSAQTWKDTDVEDGKTYTYYVVGSNDSGDGEKSEKVSVYVGQDELADVKNFKITDNTANSITFTWDEAEGKNGGYVNKSAVVYTIYTLEVKNNGYWSYLEIVDEVGTVSAATTGTIEFPVDEGEQTYQYFGVSAKSNDENETDPTAAYAYLVVGAPEELPIVEGFAGNSFHYNWNTNGGAYISNDATDGDGVALKLISEEDDTTIYFQLDKVNLRSAANPTLLFDVKGNLPTVHVIGSTDGAETHVISTENGIGQEYKQVKVSLQDIAGQRYSTVGFEADFDVSSYVGSYSATWGDTLVVDNIKIIDLLSDNLSVDLSAPKSVQAGNKITVSAQVKNVGENTVEGYNITIKAGEKELLNEDVTDALAFFETKTFEADFETTIFDEAGDVTITATVTPEVDLDDTDNVSEAIVTITQPSAASPINVTAEESENGDVTVSWNAPENSVTETTDDVESYDADDNGGLDETVHTGTIGDWTVYDGNAGKWGYGFNGVESDLGKPGSWMIFNPSTISNDLASSYPAHSGSQYFVSASVAEPESSPEQTDNWLISPELPGVAQTLKFYVRELVTSYGAETYEILASSTDKEITSFSLVASKTAATNEWAEVSVDLPEGTKYFAIRHTSTDVWALLLDDITFTVGGGEIVQYNIYVDGELETSVDADGNVIASPKHRAASNLSVVLEGIGKTLTNDSHQFAVTAVYANGVESKPEAAILETTTNGIESISVDGKPVDIYSIDGKLIRKQATSLEGLNGIYIINDKKVIVK